MYGLSVSHIYNGNDNAKGDDMKKVMLVFGTRPEAIKMCPVAKELQSRRNIRTLICVTGQHRQMLDGVLKAFSISADYDFALMREGQTLFDITAGVLSEMQTVLDKEKPDLVLVHGDTSTAFAASLAAFCLRYCSYWFSK